jgi:predicted nucleic acid-binding protein
MKLVDTSVVVKWFVAEEGQAEAELLIGESLAAPDLLLVEVSNALWKKWRKRELEAEQATMAQGMVASFVELRPSRPFAEQALAIALQLEHPVYDCFYLAMSEAVGIPLVTADQRLLGRCKGTRFEPLLEALA